MKTIITKTIAGVAIAAALLSFSAKSPFNSPSGGEGFEIYLNGKVVMQSFGKEINTAKTLQLGQASPTDKLTVSYHHCGQAGKKRMLTIKDAQEKTIKEWRFTDTKNGISDMSCQVRDIIILKKGSNQVLKLYYSSAEVPNGRMLASVVFDKKTPLTGR